MFRKLILTLVSSVCCFSTAVFAVGLGESELKSGLNQPLNAEIKLLSVGDLAEYEINASLASAAVFERVGIERPFFLNNLKFETLRDGDEVKIKITSREPIKEPFLNFLVELNSPKERVIREYTFLLDPPVFDEAASSTIEKSTQQTTTPSNTPQQAPPRARPTTTQPSQAYTGSSYGPVSANDTLWSIASRVRPNSQVSIHQTLVAIYRANPNAFANGNINNLMRGEVLTIPDAQTIADVPHRAALQDVVTQNRQWQSGGARRIVDGGTDSATNRLSGDARLTLATPTNERSTSDASSGLMDELQSTQQQLVQAQEASATLQAENEELRSRLSDLVKKLEAAQESGTLNIADAELAALAATQDSAENDNASSLESGVNEDLAANDDSINTDDAVNSDNAEITGDEGTTSDLDNQDMAAEIGSQEPVSESSAGTATDTASNASDNASVPTPQAYTRPAPKKSFFEELMDNSMVVWGSVAAVLLIVIGVFWRMRKRMEDDEFQEDLVSSVGGGSVDATESFELPDVGDDMLVELDMDEDDEKSASESDEENFDPLGEADIYIAYGKYEQAESLLLEAIDDNPIRSDLKVKLMECYAENDDKEKFESLAQEVSQAVDADEWREQIESLREQAWSGDSSGADGEFDLPSSEDIFGEDDDFGLDSDKTAALEDHSLDDDGLDDDSLDLSDDGLGFEEDNEDEEFDIDMDIGMDDDEIAIDVEESSASAVTETFDNIDDDLNLEADALDASQSDDLDLDAALDSADESIDLDDSDDISLDLDDDDFGLDEDDDAMDVGDVEDSGDEIATKLDLARAYIDMGDADGAKEILSEVIAEGTDAQKAEAQALLDKAN